MASNNRSTNAQYQHSNKDHIDEQMDFVPLQQYGGEFGKFFESDHFQNANLGKAVGALGGLLGSMGGAFANHPMAAMLKDKGVEFQDPSAFVGSLLSGFTDNAGGIAGTTGGGATNTGTGPSAPPPPKPQPVGDTGWDDNVRTNSDAIAWALERGDITEQEAEWLMQWSNESNHRQDMFAIGSGGIQDWNVAGSDLTPENRKIVSKFINSISGNWYKPGSDEFRAALAASNDYQNQQNQNNNNGGGTTGPNATQSGPGNNGRPPGGEAPTAPYMMGPGTPPPGANFMGAPSMPQPPAPVAPPVPRGQGGPQQGQGPQAPQGQVPQMQQPNMVPGYMGQGFFGGR